MVNSVKLMVKGYNANYFYVSGQLKWTHPVYYYFGLHFNNNQTQPISVGTQTINLQELVNDTSESNLGGYEIKCYFNFKDPITKTM
jgi:hypothetical protein